MKEVFYQREEYRISKATKAILLAIVGIFLLAYIVSVFMIEMSRDLSFSCLLRTIFTLVVVGGYTYIMESSHEKIHKKAGKKYNYIGIIAKDNRSCVFPNQIVTKKIFVRTLLAPLKANILGVIIIAPLAVMWQNCSILLILAHMAYFLVSCSSDIKATQILNQYDDDFMVSTSSESNGDDVIPLGFIVCVPE